MNTPVSFELAKLLKEKGFDEPCRVYIVSMSARFYGRGLTTNSELSKEGLPMLCSAPTIAEIVMWLYEKHGIWVTISMENNEEDVVSFYYTILHNDKDEVTFKKRMSDYNSPTEAYSEAIEYTLKNLI